MSLKFLGNFLDSKDISYLNSGPKKGIGRGPILTIDLLPKTKNNGPKKGKGQAPEITPPVYKSLNPSITISKSKKNEKINTLSPHLGPKKGLGLGPGAYLHPELGPKRGIGVGPGIDPGFLYADGADSDIKLCIKLTNEFREKNGKLPLFYSKELTIIAMPHTKKMLSGQIPLGHDGFQERSKKVLGAKSTGENVAYCDGYSNPIETMVKGWIKSPPHRKNMLGDFNTIGIALAHDGSLWFGTQFFAYKYS